MMQKIKLLIVEDEAIVALFLKVQLEKRGYLVCGLVTTGEQAIKVARTEEPDIIIMDVHLAGKMDGLQTATAIRLFSKANIIVVTGYEDEELRKEVEELKSSAFIIKPVSINDILEIIEHKFKYIV
jgi:DNA-binding NarL/FixJ family response regulator